MSIEQGKVENEAVKEALAELLKPMPHGMTNGHFIRHMFLEAIAVKAGVGQGIDEEGIIKHTGMSDREFIMVKDEYIVKGIVKEEKNMFDVVLYSLCLT